MKISNKSLLVGLTVLVGGTVFAQSSKVKFSGQGRAVMQFDQLMESDTVNEDNSNSGYQQVDLSFDIKPMRNTQISAQMRLRNEYGAFFGVGSAASFRQLKVEGRITEQLSYQVGDINYEMTPYTLFNTAGEGQINEATIFSQIRDIQEYENFNQGNTWRQQGVQLGLDYELEDSFLKSWKAEALLARNRAGVSVKPEILMAGGLLRAQVTDEIGLGANFISLFDVYDTDPREHGMRNPVLTGNLNYNRDLSGKLFTMDVEAGASKLSDTDVDTVFDDYFYDVQFGLDMGSGLAFGLGYKNVGAHFFSPGAQAKRIDVSQNPALFSRVTNSQIFRGSTGYDYLADVSYYNMIIAYDLMDFDPRLTNTLPYGEATPNRTGVDVGVAYMDSAGRYGADLKAYVMSEVVGEGSNDKRSFLLIQAKTDWALNKLIGWEKSLVLNVGYQFESTSRDGTEYTSIDLTSGLLDAGLDWEFSKGFSLMGGVKMLSAAGTERVARRGDYNQVSSFTLFDLDESELLYGFGLRYNFNEYIHISAQYQGFSYTDNSSDAVESTYDFGQTFILFNMTF